MKLYFFRIILSIISILTITLIVLGQSNSNSQNKQKQPEKIKFLIKAVGEDDKKKGKLTFKVGEKIIIKTLLKNESSAPFPLIISNDYYQYPFQLWKIGERSIRGVRADKARAIFNAEENPGLGVVMQVDPLPSGTSIELKTFNLGEFYESIEPGRYKVNFFYRTVGNSGDVQISSNTLILEIVP